MDRNEEIVYDWFLDPATREEDLIKAIKAEVRKDLENLKRSEHHLLIDFIDTLIKCKYAEEKA